VIGRQQVDLEIDEHAFRTELADCRTFGFMRTSRPCAPPASPRRLA